MRSKGFGGKEVKNGKTSKVDEDLVAFRGGASGGAWGNYDPVGAPFQLSKSKRLRNSNVIK